MDSHDIYPAFVHASRLVGCPVCGMAQAALLLGAALAAGAPPPHRPRASRLDIPAPRAGGMPRELAIAYVNDVSAVDNPFLLVEGSVRLVNTTMLPGMGFPDQLPNTRSVSQGFACDASMWPAGALATAQYSNESE